MTINERIQRVVTFIQQDIWHIERSGIKPLTYLCIEVLKKLILAVRFFTTKRVVNHAAALTYSTMLAIVPILAVVFAIARGFGYSKYIEIWFREAFKSQPQAADVIIGFVNSYLVHTKSGIFLGVGLLFMLYTVLMLVSNIEQTFNEIWQVKKKRSIYRTFTDYLAAMFVFPLVIVITSGISIFMTTIDSHTNELLLVGPVVHILIDLLPYVLMWILFIGLYIFMPNTHVKITNVLVPALLAGVAMQWLQLFYIHSQIWVSSYNAIYGSFAALPLFMLWVQISWTICLFGAELCYTNQNLDYYDYNTQTSDISYRYRMLLSSILLGKICKRFDEGGKPFTAMQLHDITAIPIRIVVDLLYDMIDAQLVIEITADEKGESAQFVPAENVDNISFGMLIDRLEAYGKWKLDLSLGDMYSEELKRALKLRSNYLKQSRNILLKNL